MEKNVTFIVGYENYFLRSPNSEKVDDHMIPDGKGSLRMFSEYSRLTDGVEYQEISFCYIDTIANFDRIVNPSQVLVFKNVIFRELIQNQDILNVLISGEYKVVNCKELFLSGTPSIRTQPVQSIILISANVSDKLVKFLGENRDNCEIIDLFRPAQKNA